MKQPHLVMATANTYVHQPGILQQAGEWIGKYGKRAFIVTGRKSWAAVEDILQPSLKTSGIDFHMETYRGECSYEEVERLSALLDPRDDLIIGVGGGKVLDTAKALSNHAGIDLITIPTIAATCAAVTNLSVMYTEEGVYSGFPIFYKNPVLTLVDTQVMAQAPVRYLVSGIGDTIAKWYESSACSSGKELNAPTLAGLQMARLLYDILLEHSESAVDEANRQVPDKALQQVVDAVILLSGTVGGFGEENCRSAAAHAIHNGLTILPQSHSILHGVKVAYGIIVQLALENRPEQEIADLLRFYRKIGLPATLKELGIDQQLSDEQLDRVAGIAMLPESTMAMMPIAVTKEKTVEAMKYVERTFKP